MSTAEAKTRRVNAAEKALNRSAQQAIDAEKALRDFEQSRDVEHERLQADVAEAEKKKAQAQEHFDWISKMPVFDTP